LATAITIQPESREHQPGCRRQHERFHFDRRITARAFREGKAHRFWGRTSDLSESGLSVTFVETLELGEVVTLDVTLPASPDAMTLSACVRYRNGYFCGLEFLVVSDRQREAIRKACRVLSAKS
jgi:c-di-GMP-binding flagellar brake protein YcgR